MGYGGLLRLDTAFATGFLVECRQASIVRSGDEHVSVVVKAELSSAIIWAMFFLQGVYTYLFIAALPGMTSSRRLKDSQRAKSAWVFLTFSILMYVVATSHLILGAFRFYKSIFLNVDPNGAISYLKSWHHWEYFPLIVLFCVQTWLGDALVIYRCYFVWGCNLLFILVPVCLLLASFAVNIIIWYWIYHPFNIPRKQAVRIFRCIYPLAFAQNLMTTSLIIFKILSQHRASKKAGVIHAGSALSLMRVVRIIVESASIYTVQLLVLIILYFRGDNGQYVVQAAINPSIGMTFVLLAIRIQPSRTTNVTMGTDQAITSTLIPQWLRSSKSDIDSENSDDYSSHSLSRLEDGIELTNVHKIDA
ncbi:hypothetical protein D9619_013299 [Psilocybe cf. subviscida]|uniref:Uncharacterized protein n=1 Tax=Psilocybe cf. subviscida TaxID=2480587 RepID=A0A8H5BTU9_9AGAR|nr:hypothetical protein D9619_013299 [Psilocybe cf. subviscida]